MGISNFGNGSSNMGLRSSIQSLGTWTFRLELRLQGVVRVRV